LLEPFRYQGILRQLCGHRWWRAELEGFYWELCDGQSPSRRVIRKALEEKSGTELPEAKLGSEPVLVFNENYGYAGELVAASATADVILDDWPAYAYPPPRRELRDDSGGRDA
jgi:hypothetical protein